MRRFLSLGAGVQSTTLYLMACAGELGDKPEAAIFADTQWEPEGVYRHLDWLESLELSVPIVRVTAGNIKEDTLAGLDAQKFASMPFYAYNEEGEKAMLQRQCTKDYKIMPVRWAIKEALDIKRGSGTAIAELWIGISLDEIQRMKPPDVRWLSHRWPLIEKRMSRHACIEWLSRNGYPTPPKSACIGCPFHSARVWGEMRRNDPASWQEAVTFDRAIRNGLGRLKSQVFLVPSCLPLEDAVAEEDLQYELDLWPNECEGMCGV